MTRSEAQADLHASFISLSERWAEARRLWRDNVAVEFEREFWEEIVEVTRGVERAAEALQDLLEQALRRTDT